ncbi:hypothetical protein K2173_012758 [Erythroxylum novogranatense]|uniref:Uncharacterized protein n=1 Tax=Erythroxylum novogranatense TaxID=1862640 RepID=A0AAV8TVY3_9ROSI|nr:hypothetical protein K2173_012758 [Erythroxylum novogranatense]
MKQLIALQHHSYPAKLLNRPNNKPSTLQIISASRRDAYDPRDYNGKVIDENMIVLRKRIHEIKLAERSYDENPSEWMSWEKKYYSGKYSSDVCEAVGLLQSMLMNTRPSLALGMVALLALAIPTSAVITTFRLVEMSQEVQDRHIFRRVSSFPRLTEARGGPNNSLAPTGEGPGRVVEAKSALHAK